MTRAILISAIALTCSVPCEGFAQRSYPVELQIMPLKASVQRHVSTPNRDPSAANGSISGVEASIMGSSSGLGLFGRYLTSNLTGPAKRMIAEGGIQLGDKAFKIEIGFAERLYLPVDSTMQFLRGGINVTTFLGTSGAAVRLRGGYYAALDRFRSDKSAPDGWQGETSVSYTWDRLPIFAQLGYRIERMRRGQIDEETTALTLGAGIWLWSR